MTINQVKCDGCRNMKHKEPTENNILEYLIPDRWSTFMSKDLCPDCTKKVEEFIQGLKV